MPTRKLEFVARTVTDIGKAAFAVGLASYFFERYAIYWRIAIPLFSIAMIVEGILIYPGYERGED